jgi:ferritin-like metal-binding protein YciE
MTANTLDQQLTKYLTDAHSIELQALAQLKTAPKIAGDKTLARAFAEHLTETEQHERLMRDRLDARGASPAKIKDLAGTLTGKTFVLFARGNPDTPGKLVAHAYSYEHMELAAYELLRRVAEREGDADTVRVAKLIGEQERAMGDRLAESFDRAVEASLRELKPDDLDRQLNKYLADAHAIEAQAIQLLKKGQRLAGDAALAAVYEEHLDQTHQHQRLLESRLSQRGSAPSTIKDAALRLGALNWGMFFQAQPDTPAKLAGFSYAFEHLEIGAYELLKRVARRAGDADAERVSEQILAQERTAAERVHSQFAAALDASLHLQEVSRLSPVSGQEKGD